MECLAGVAGGSDGAIGCAPVPPFTPVCFSLFDVDVVYVMFSRFSCARELGEGADTLVMAVEEQRQRPFTRV